MITTKQRAYLRALASKKDAIFQVGKGGINDKMIESVSDALEAHELIKLHALDNSDYGARDAAEEMAERLGADVVCVIGSKFVLYRESEKHRKISIEIQS
ncbi:MAG: YhbY family RNA-binding protein, partial [Clostridiales bacterium]|nr:YhbY family RNA-binding protein [Clostridiales bacterium]